MHHNKRTKLPIRPIVPCLFLPQGVAVEHWCCTVRWRLHLLLYPDPGGSDGKESASNVGDPGLIPRSGRSTGEGNGNHSSILDWKIPWMKALGWLTVHGVAKSRTQLSDFSFFLSFQIPARTAWYPRLTLQVHGCWFTVIFFSNASQPHPLCRVRMSSALQILRGGPNLMASRSTKRSLVIKMQISGVFLRVL